MISAVVAAVAAMFALVFVEGLRVVYPSKETWLRLRRIRGRAAVKSMRQRFEAASLRRVPRLLVEILLGLVIIWTAAASLLDKRWYEVLLDALPYAIVLLALVRTPTALFAVAERMKGYERDAGDEPESPNRGNGTGIVAQ